MEIILLEQLVVLQENLEKQNILLKMQVELELYLLISNLVFYIRRIHILGSFQNIKIARDAVCNLILGSPPGKVYAHLRVVASRMRERF